MMRSFARLLVAMLAFSGVGEVAACEPKLTWPELVSAADEIFIGRVVVMREKHVTVDGKSELFFEGEYELAETLKGAPPKHGVVHDFPYFGFGSCGLGLMIGQHYLFMIDEDNDDFPGLRWVAMPTGSFMLAGYPDRSDEYELLAELRTQFKK